MRALPFFPGLLLLFLVGPAAYAQTEEAAEDYPYQVETIETPEGLVAETGGLDFLPDGRLVAVFRRGEVMIYDPETKQWDVFATGLHDPLGVAALGNDELLVGQRPEVTRVKDTDGDGRADLYETVSDAFGMSGNYAEFTHGPIRDQVAICTSR